jgi:hypothetical protein
VSRVPTLSRVLKNLRFLVFLAPFAAGCHCSHASEPEKSADYNPTSSSGLAKPPPTPAQNLGMTEQEFKDYRIHLAHELCDQAFEHINVLNGKPPTDSNPVAVMLRGACITQGNNAWYKCQLKAQTKEELAVCNQRFFRAPN